MSRYADFLQIEAWGVINAGEDPDQLCEPADHTKVPLSPIYGLGIFLCLLERQEGLSQPSLETLILRRAVS